MKDPLSHNVDYRWWISSPLTPSASQLDRTVTAAAERCRFESYLGGFNTVQLKLIYIAHETNAISQRKFSIIRSY